MIQRKKVAISIGDLQGIGIQLALENHAYIQSIVDPIYCIDNQMLTRASDKLNIPIPQDFKSLPYIAPIFDIQAGAVTQESGRYAYASFVKAVELAKEHQVEAICTLPIHKKAWELAGVSYKGHTDALRDFFDAKAIMMLGCPQMYVALFTEHIPLREVANKIEPIALREFLLDFHAQVTPDNTVAVLGLNPHAGDAGVLGTEEREIQQAIDQANRILSTPYPAYSNPIVPDVAFTPNHRKKYQYFIAMYHDQGLAALKALYFDEGINVSLNLPILRTSVDHGTAFDIAYQGKKLNALSYLNAIRYIQKENTPST